MSVTQQGQLPDVGLGFLGLIGAVIGALVGFAATTPWYRILIALLFVLGCFNSFLVRKVWPGLAWLLLGIGFFVGFRLWGRWGMLIGLLAAFLISTPLVNILEGRVFRARGL